MRRPVAIGLAVVLIAATLVVGAARWGMERRAEVRVTGPVSAGFTFSEHAGGPSASPCEDSVTSGQRPAFAFPQWLGDLHAGVHTMGYFAGRTAAPPTDSAIGAPLAIHTAGTYNAAVTLAIDGRSYFLDVGSVSIGTDGSGSGRMAGNDGTVPPTEATMTATISWSCQDGLIAL